MYFIYNILLSITSILLSPLILFALLREEKYRMGLSQKLGFLPPHLLLKLSGSRPVWIHAVSVGEVTSTIPLIQEIKKRYPSQKIILSTVTVTGNYTATIRVREVDAVIYFPLDYPFIVKKVIRQIKPKLFIILETELWPNILRELKRNNIPSVVVSGRISNRSYHKYRWGRFFFTKVLDNIHLFCMQTEVDSKRIINIGADKDRVTTVGNLKFDQCVPTITTEEKENLYNMLSLKEGQTIFIAGSTHKGEENIVLEVFKNLKKTYEDLILILAPRHPERFDEVADLISHQKLRSIKKTKIKVAQKSNHHDIILLDTIGELSKLYSIGTIIFVGGSLVSTGGHNVLEPVAYKKAVIFGPHMDNFSEISRCLRESGGGFQVNNQEEFLSQTEMLLQNDVDRDKLGEKAFEVIAHNQGAINKSMEAIKRFL
ncbi:MAG: 3-deoxy-D-manno-octulosonic acid transferase [Deltaproteobacteria bacterium]|jgi:3-deoxy-D-manno-octulosonic-acid transferase|nr:3-deoxy-D-manno-octulosonic acid transferase [Deltaproteobacteria bacterium]